MARPTMIGARPLSAETAADLAFRRDVVRVHDLGARSLYELLAELGSERAIQNIVDQKVAKYARIDPTHLTALGGDDFGPLPLHLVAP